MSSQEEEEIFEDLPPPDDSDPVVELFGHRGRPSAPQPNSELVRRADQGSDSQDELVFNDPAPSDDENIDVFSTRRRRLTPHETNQRFLVLTVMFLLLLAVITICLAWLFNPAVDLQGITTTLLTPLLAFAGPIMGFYFGRRDKSGQQALTKTPRRALERKRRRRKNRNRKPKRR